MKKIIIALAILTASINVYSQAYTNKLDVKNDINAKIIPNSTRAITPDVMKKILLGLWEFNMDSAWLDGTNLKYKRGSLIFTIPFTTSSGLSDTSFLHKGLTENVWGVKNFLNYTTVLAPGQGDSSNKIPSTAWVRQYIATHGVTETDPVWTAASVNYFTKAQSDVRFVPLTRNITINGVTQDLSVNRTWTIPPVDTMPLHNQILTKLNAGRDVTGINFAGNDSVHTLILTKADATILSASFFDRGNSLLFPRTTLKYLTGYDNVFGNLYDSVRLAHSFVAGSGAYNSTTGVITIPTNNNQIANGAGYITGGNITIGSTVIPLGTTALNIAGLNTLNLTTNPLGTSSYYFGQTMATDDAWRMYGRGDVIDKGETILELRDNGQPYESGGQRFRVWYSATTDGVAKYAFTIDYDTTSTPNPIVSPSFVGNLNGNANTVTNGVYTTGSYANPSWITSLAWSKVTGTPTTISGYGITDFNSLGDARWQPLDADLTTIAGLTATTDNFIQSKAGAWASRTIAQVKTDLGITGTNSGDQTITLTGDITGSGTGSFATTLATVNGNVGTWNNVTVNGKGLVTAGSNVAYLISSQTYYIGTTLNALNRASAAQTLTGVSIDGNSATTTLAANSTLWNGLSYVGLVTPNTYMMTYNGSNQWGASTVAQVKTFLGLDAAGGYLPLVGGSGSRMTGSPYMANNIFWYGRNVANSADASIIGFNNANRVSVDGDGYGTNFGGAIFLPNSSSINGRDVGNTIYIPIISLNNANKISIDANGYGSVFGGALTGTSATFSGNTTSLNHSLTAATSFLTGGDATGRLIISNSGTSTYMTIYGASHATVPNVINFITNSSVALTLASNQAATFSSSVTATAFYQSSDIRLKDVISNDDGLLKFTYKGSNEIHYGYSAQEIEKQYPEVVHTKTDGYKEMNYTELHTIQIEQLKKEIVELKKRIK